MPQFAANVVRAQWAALESHPRDAGWLAGVPPRYLALMLYEFVFQVPGL